MSGHSKWATTKHRKGAQDAKRSALFSKLSRNITVAARLGNDPNPDNNASLAAAVAKAKAQSMPKDKIKAAIDKAFGSGADAAVYENIVYEGYGPAGVAVYVECLTDNRNRTAADVRSAFSHAGGNLGTTGSVAFQFERKGQVVVSKQIVDPNDKKENLMANGAAGDEEEFMMVIAEAGGDDYEDAGDEWVVWTAAGDLMAVSKGIEAQGIEVKGAELTMVPTTPTAVSGADAKKVQRLIDRLEDLDDVQDVYSTMDMTDEVIAALEEESHLDAVSAAWLRSACEAVRIAAGPARFIMGKRIARGGSARVASERGGPMRRIRKIGVVLYLVAAVVVLGLFAGSPTRDTDRFNALLSVPWVRVFAFACVCVVLIQHAAGLLIAAIADKPEPAFLRRPPAIPILSCLTRTRFHFPHRRRVR